MLAEFEHFDEIASATLAGRLLRTQYNLDDGELDELLAFRTDDVGSLAWMGHAVEIATGLCGARERREMPDG
jgi:hypothetical protein